MKKETILRSIDIDPWSGMMSLRYGVRIVDDGHVLSERWHRVSVEPGGTDLDTLIGMNSRDIVERDDIRGAPIDPTHLPLVKAIRDMVQTQDIVERYQAAATASLAS